MIKKLKLSSLAMLCCVAFCTIGTILIAQTAITQYQVENDKKKEKKVEGKKLPASTKEMKIFEVAEFEISMKVDDKSLIKKPSVSNVVATQSLKRERQEIQPYKAAKVSESLRESRNSKIKKD